MNLPTTELMGGGWTDFWNVVTEGAGNIIRGGQTGPVQTGTTVIVQKSETPWLAIAIGGGALLLLGGVLLKTKGRKRRR